MVGNNFVAIPGGGGERRKVEMEVGWIGLDYMSTEGYIPYVVRLTGCCQSSLVKCDSSTVAPADNTLLILPPNMMLDGNVTQIHGKPNNNYRRRCEFCSSCQLTIDTIC